MEAVHSPEPLTSSWLLLFVPRQEQNILEAPAARSRAAPGCPGRGGTAGCRVPTPDVTGNLLLGIDRALIGHVIPGLTEPRFPCTDSNL